MKGLLIKDIKLLKNQLRFYAALVAIGLMMMIFQDNIMFAISYISVMFGMFTLSSISYDEMDNGTAFLMTLPVTRKSYVQEKYVFGLLAAGGSWIVATLIGLITVTVKMPQEDPIQLLSASVGILMVVIVMLSMILPVEICFGVERGRIAMWGVTGGMILLIIGGIKVLELMKIDYEAMVEQILMQKGIFIMGIGILLVIAIVILSQCIAVKGMEKKEF